MDKQIEILKIISEEKALAELSFENRIIDRLWKSGFSEEDILMLKGNLPDPVRVNLANRIRDKYNKQITLTRKD